MKGRKKRRGGARWTDAERAFLLREWCELAPRRIKERLRPRSWAAIRQYAIRKLGLPGVTVPQGARSLSSLAVLLGFERASLERIIQWAGARIGQVYPVRNSRVRRGARERAVFHRRWADEDEAREAVERWMACETCAQAAKRTGVHPPVLAKVARRLGYDRPEHRCPMLPPRGERKRAKRVVDERTGAHWRMDPATWDLVASKVRARGVAWTAAEDATMRAQWPAAPSWVALVAALPGRSRHSIACRARTLRLGPWSQRYEGTETMGAAARRLGVTVDVLRVRLDASPGTDPRSLRHKGERVRLAPATWDALLGARGPLRRVVARWTTGRTKWEGYECGHVGRPSASGHANATRRMCRECALPQAPAEAAQ